MGKYFITGNAGSGKSTVIRELARRGFSAYDTDDLPDVTRHEKSHHSALAYASVWNKAALGKLLTSDNTVFVGASVSNQQEFYPLFDKVFGLSIDKNTLEQRLSTRRNNSFGNDPSHRQFILSIHDRVEKNLLSAGATIIDGSQPVAKVVDQILSHMN